MELNLNLQYKKLPSDVSNAATMTRVVLERSVNTKYADGKMPSNESRMWSKILDQFADETDAIEIDGSQFDWLKDVVDKTDLPAMFSSWLWVVRSALDDAKRGKEKPQPLKEVKKTGGGD